MQTDAGSATLADLFQGRSQLLVYHFMFGPDYKAGCPSCSSIADGFNGIVTHLAHHDVMLWAVSRAPLDKLQIYKRRMGWTFPWASSAGSDFNYDFNASFTETQQREGPEYNFRRDDPAMKLATAAAPPPEFVSWAATTGTDPSTYLREREGMSAFVLQDGVVYHSYSSYSRGTDAIWGMYAGWTARRKGATRAACGCAATNTASHEAPGRQPGARGLDGRAGRRHGDPAMRMLCGAMADGMACMRIDERIPCRAVVGRTRPGGPCPRFAPCRRIRGIPGKGEFLVRPKEMN